MVFTCLLPLLLFFLNQNIDNLHVYIIVQNVQIKSVKFILICKICNRENKRIFWPEICPGNCLIAAAIKDILYYYKPYIMIRI